MATTYTVTTREGPRVERQRHSTLDQALEDLASAVDHLAVSARATPVKVGKRRYEPGDQVAARVELSGPQRFFPKLRAGVDVRGDGSIQAYTGRAQRTLIDPGDGEAALQALARVVLEQE
ncbi:MAG: hypothetical protein ACR2HD_06025 [Solirubrobacteraceae bacterium]|nr:MAG: hypothetical protein DLM63_10985 [Solirubrobacterales bacterium]